VTPPSTGTSDAFFEYLLRLGDDRLVLGHRLSEWCGHAPILEEDIALANIALDLVGQGTMLLKLAGETEGKGRSEDALAYFRDAVELLPQIVLPPVTTLPLERFLEGVELYRSGEALKVVFTP